MMTFVIGFFSFILVMLGTVWLIARLFRIKPKPVASAPAPAGAPGSQQPAAKPATPPQSGIAKYLEKKWVRPVVIIGLVAILFYFWSSISSTLATWLVGSDGGKAVGLSNSGSVQRWLWIPGTILALALLRMLFKPKSDTPGTWGQKSIGELLSAINGGILMWAVVLIPTVIVLDVIGFFDDVSKIPVKMSRAAACTTQDDAWNIPIDTAGRKMVVCSEKKPLFVFPEKGGGTLVFDFSEEFKEKNKDLLKGRSLQDFVLISAPSEYRGHAADAWRIMPLKSRPELKFVSAWDRSGMKDISIVVHSAD